MDKLFNVLATATILVAFYFVGYSITMIIYTEFFQEPAPTQTITIEELVRAYETEFPAATPWETCEQETE
jgi:hypothetical protein